MDALGWSLIALGGVVACWVGISWRDRAVRARALRQAKEWEERKARFAERPVLRSPPATRVHPPALAGGSTLPPVDAPEPEPAPAATPEPPGREAIVSALVAIEYVDAKGESSRRRITIRTIEEKAGGDLAIRAFCHERRAARMFLASRVRSVFDPETGEVHGDGQFFRSHIAYAGEADAWQARERERAIDRVRAELAILVYGARCDGKLGPAERQVILDYIEKRCADLSYDRKSMSAYVGRMYPDDEVFAAAVPLALLSLSSGGGETATTAIARLPDFAAALEALVHADGKLEIDEVEFLTDLGIEFEKYGIKLHLDEAAAS